MASKAVLKIGKNVKEFRLHLCQKSITSQGVRDFIENNYVTLKKENPKLPFLIRECSNIEPKIWARYEFGREECVALSNNTSDQVVNAINNLSKISF